LLTCVKTLAKVLSLARLVNDSVPVPPLWRLGRGWTDRRAQHDCGQPAGQRQPDAASGPTAIQRHFFRSLRQAALSSVRYSVLMAVMSW
jgi:hypothetical protein